MVDLIKHQHNIILKNSCPLGLGDVARFVTTTLFPRQNIVSIGRVQPNCNILAHMWLCQLAGGTWIRTLHKPSIGLIQLCPPPPVLLSGYTRVSRGWHRWMSPIEGLWVRINVPPASGTYDLWMRPWVGQAVHVTLSVTGRRKNLDWRAVCIKFSIVILSVKSLQLISKWVDLKSNFPVISFNTDFRRLNFSFGWYVLKCVKISLSILVDFEQ